MSFIRFNGNGNIILCPASSLWKLQVKQQVYRLRLPKEIEAHSLLILRHMSVDAALEEWHADDKQQPQFQSAPDGERQIHTVRINTHLMPVQQSFLELRWPLSSVAVHQGIALKTKAAWEELNPSPAAPEAQK